MATTSNPTTVPPAYQQWQNILPAPQQQSYNPFDNYLDNQIINQNINQGTDKIISGLNDATQYTTANIHGVSKDLSASTLGLRDAIERGNLINGNAIERTSGDIKLNGTILDAANRQAFNDSFRDVFRDVDSNGSRNNATTERVGSNLNSTVERTAAQIERLAGEGRLTTTVTDAASRQANNDSIRDVLRSVAATDTAIERTAGEIRSNFLNSSNGLSSIITDTRKTITDNVNRGTNELIGLLNSNNQSMSGLINDLGDQARTSSSVALLEDTKGMANLAQQSASHYASLELEQQKSAAILAQQSAGQYANLALDQQKTAALLAQQSAGQYSNTMLEQQKSTAILSHENSNHYSGLMLEQHRMKEYLASKGDSHFAMNQLEQQKSTAVLSHENSNHYSGLMLEQHRMKEYLASKGDSHFAMNQLELQKVKEGLTFQAAQNFASLQLEAAKTAGLISAQMAEAKFDGLKNTQFLADKMSECCCEVKMKIDHVDRDRLRDNLIVEKSETNLLKVAEFIDRRGDRNDRRFFGGGFEVHSGHHHHGEGR